MYNPYPDFGKSVHTDTSNIEPLPINNYKISNEQIQDVFPNVIDEQIEKIKYDLLTITEILYNLNNNEN